MSNLKRRVSEPEINSEKIEAQERLSESEQELNDAIAEDMEKDEDKVYDLLAGFPDPEDPEIIHTTFTLREMTGKDEEAMQKPDVRGNMAKAITTLLARCVTSIGTLTPKDFGGINEWKDKVISKLLIGDQDYILYKLRVLSYGNEFTVKHVCPNPDCKANLTTVIEGEDFEIIPFDGNRKIPFELPKGFNSPKGYCKTGTLRLPTGEDREKFAPIARKNPARGTTLMLTRLCHFDNNAYLSEETIASLSVKDRSYLNDLLEEHIFGVKDKFTLTCPECGEEYLASLGDTNFL